jgi:outer membrane protein OmpA-like peptidoglycan-associated protein
MMRHLVLSALLAWPAFHAGAQTTLHYREGERVEPREVQRILQNDGGPTATRSIRLLAQPDGTDATAPAAATSVPQALSLPVQFEFDSSAILASARPQLDALAEGIKLLPPGRRVTIEGHTDATGPEGYNEQLSRLRAAAVKSYLVHTHGIDAARLRDIGVGKRDPIGGSDPFAPENRRVQFRGG